MKSSNDGYIAYYFCADVSNLLVVLLCDETEIRNVCTQTKEYGISRAFFSLARWSKWLTAQFLVQLYLAQPRVMRSIKDFRSLTTSGAITQSSVCQVRNHDIMKLIISNIK